MSSLGANTKDTAFVDFITRQVSLLNECAIDADFSELIDNQRRICRGKHVVS